MSEEAKPRRRVAEVVEKGVEGLYDFLFRLMNTVWAVSWSRRPIRLLICDRHRLRIRYVYPHTYAAVGIFLVSLVASVAGYWMLDWIWFYEEISANVVNRLGEGVSLVNIAIGSIPAFLFMLGLSAVIGVIERRRGRAGRALFATCYAIGTQSIYLFFAAVLVSLAQLVPGGVGESQVEEGWLGTTLGTVLAIALIVSLLASFVLPALFFAHAFRAPRGSRWWVFGRAVAYLPVTIFSMTALPLIASIPNLLVNAVAPPSKPVIEFESDAVVTVTPQGPSVTVDVLIKNPGARIFGTPTDEVSAVIRYGQEPLENEEAETVSLDPLRVENEAGQPVGFSAVEPGSVAWRRVTFQLEHDFQADELGPALADDMRRCLRVEFGVGSASAESMCSRLSFDDRRPKPALRADPPAD